MTANRPAPIELPAQLPAAPSRAVFARGTGRDFTASATEIALYDEIGPGGVTAADFRAALRQASGDLVVRLNSPGGSVFESIGMFNDLAAYAGHVRVEITGVAASGASLLAMAGDEIAIAENAHMMIHRAWGATLGNVEDHNESAKLLARIDASMAQTYSARTGHDVASIQRMLAAETWLTGREAVDAGFADEVSSGAVTARARFDLSVYAKSPAELRADFAAIDQDNPRDLERALRDVGVSRSRARAIVSRGLRDALHCEGDDDAATALAAYISTQAEQLKSI